MNCFNPAVRQLPRASVPISVQMQMRVSEHPGTHILDYIAKCEHAAAIRNRRDLVQHYHECWMLVFERVNGLLPLPIQSYQTRPLCPEPPVLPLKGWEKQKYSRPARKVVSRADVPIRDRYGNVSHRQTILTLECGHTFEHLGEMPAEAKPVYRRCWQCANDEHAANVEGKRLQVVKRAK